MKYRIESLRAQVVNVGWTISSRTEKPMVYIHLGEHPNI
jgi:hypothetical protein